MTANEQRGLKHLFENRWFIFFTAAATVILIIYQLSRQQIGFTTEFHSAGENLLYGIRTPETSLCMPFTSLLISLFRYHTSAGTETLAAGLNLLTYLLFFAIGMAGGGVFRGLLYSMAAALLNLTVRVHDVEQLVYAPMILLYAAVELRRAAKTAAGMALAGLALGLTLITRSPLFLFPPLFLLWDTLEHPAAGAAGWKRRMMFLACSYIALIPWLRLTHSLSGTFQLFEGARLECNLIVATQGAVFAPAASECRTFAGIAPDKNIYFWAVNTILHSPAPYLISVFRRLWQIFLMFPALFLLAGLALPLRKKEDRFMALLAGYFLAAHSLLAIEGRYLYPLRYLLLLLGLSGTWGKFIGRWTAAKKENISGILIYGLFGSALAFGVFVELLVLKFSSSPENPIESVGAALKRWPGNPWLAKKRRELLLYSPLPGPTRTEEIPEEKDLDRSGSPYPPLLSGLTAALKKGDTMEAAKMFEKLKALWDSGNNGLTIAPYGQDRELDRRIREANRTLWDTDIYGAILRYPPGRRAAMIHNLAKITALTPKLRYLALNGCNSNEAETKELLEILPSEELPPWLNRHETACRLLTTALKNTPSCKPSAMREKETLILNALELDLKANPGRLVERYRPDPGSWSDAEILTLANLARTLLHEKPAEQGPGWRAKPKNDILFSWLSLRTSGCSVTETEAIKKLLDLDPFPIEAAASFYAEINQHENASRLMAALNPEDSNLNSALFSALILQELKEYERALKFAERAKALSPSDPVVLNQRGILLRLMGNLSGAELDFRRAMEISPGYLPAIVNLASLSEADGRTDEAVTYYTKALESGKLPAAVHADLTRALANLLGHARQGTPSKNEKERAVGF